MRWNKRVHVSREIFKNSLAIIVWLPLKKEIKMGKGSKKLTREKYQGLILVM